MKLSDIPEHVLANVRKRGWSDEDIAQMPAKKIFSEHCDWQGLWESIRICGVFHAAAA
jgi:hypothetical protein